MQNFIEDSKEVINMENETKMVIYKNINEASDSLEIGTPGKLGAIKIYGDFSKPEEFKKKIDAAKEVREYAQANLSVNV